MPVLAVVGEHAMGGEGFLALAHLAGILDQVKAVKLDAGCDMRGGGASRGPARRKNHFFAVPLAREHCELAVLLQRRRCGEMVLGHRLQAPFTAFTIFFAASPKSSAGRTVATPSCV